MDPPRWHRHFFVEQLWYFIQRHLLSTRKRTCLVVLQIPRWYLRCSWDDGDSSCPILQDLLFGALSSSIRRLCQVAHRSRQSFLRFRTTRVRLVWQLTTESGFVIGIQSTQPPFFIGMFKAEDFWISYGIFAASTNSPLGPYDSTMCSRCNPCRGISLVVTCAFLGPGTTITTPLYLHRALNSVDSNTGGKAAFLSPRGFIWLSNMIVRSSIPLRCQVRFSSDFFPLVFWYHGNRAVPAKAPNTAHRNEQ